MDGIGKKIKELRKKAKISQEKLAFELNVSRQTVSNWETDSIQPALENILAICKFFNTDPKELISDYEPVISDNEQAIAESRYEVSGFSSLPECTGIITYISPEYIKSEKKAPSKKKRDIIWTMLIISLIIVGLIFGFLLYLYMPMDGASETVSTSSWNFDDKSVLYGFIVGTVFFILLIITFSLVIRHIKNKK